MFIPRHQWVEIEIKHEGFGMMEKYLPFTHEHQNEIPILKARLISFLANSKIVDASQFFMM
ncbi:hypothetical protein ES703_41992 [subsurface metagenome]